MKNIKNQLQQLNLSTEEDNEIIVNVDQQTEEINKGKKILLGDYMRKW